MTMYAASREVLAEALWVDTGEGHRDIADRLIDSGVVKVIDPDDEVTVDKVVLILVTCGLTWEPEPVARLILRALAGRRYEFPCFP